VEPGAYSIVGSALLHQRHLEIATNNLANMNTVGYKAERPLFRLDANFLPPGEFPHLGKDAIQRSLWSRTHIDFTQGNIKQTGNPLDVALNGPGFFVLQTPDGPRYTRAGQFKLNGAGDLISPEGWPVLARGGNPIRLAGAALAGAKILIGGAGEVQVGGQAVGQLDVVDFPAPYRLEKRGGATFALTDPDARSTPVAAPRIVQGALEHSNVGSVAEMVGLIETARLYEAYQKILQSFDDARGRAVNDLGRVQESA